MNTMFPFGFPWPTAFYLVFYVATLVLHWVFMQYVLAGSAYTVAARLLPAKADAPRPIDDLLRDWLPLMLSGAITAGIAPLLFLQILYQRQFYTANVLLFHRWMAILPTLIVGFYLLYLLRSKRFDAWPLAVRLAVAGATFACFGFVAWSWTENHLLSLNSGVWSEQYVSGRLMYHSKQLLPRLVMWFVMAFPTMATIIAWQLWYTAARSNAEIPGRRRTCAVALAGLLLSAAATGIYVMVLTADQRDVIYSPLSLPYVIMAFAGWVIQIAAWAFQYKNARLRPIWLVLASLGIALTLTGVAVAREALRIAAIDLPALYARHAAAAKVGGLATFFVFVVINSALITWAILLVRRGMKQ